MLEIQIFLNGKFWNFYELSNFENRSGSREVGNFKIWGHHDFRISLENIFWEIWKIWSVSFKFPRRTEPTREGERESTRYLEFFILDDTCGFEYIIYWNFNVYLNSWFIIWYFLPFFLDLEIRGIKVNWAGTWNLRVAGARKCSIWPLMGKIHWLKDVRNFFWKWDNLSSTRRPRALA